MLQLLSENYQKDFQVSVEAYSVEITSVTELFPLDDDNASFHAFYLIFSYQYNVSMQIARTEAFSSAKSKKCMSLFSWQTSLNFPDICSLIAEEVSANTVIVFLILYC